jgi:hypothetical protein
MYEFVHGFSTLQQALALHRQFIRDQLSLNEREDAQSARAANSESKGCSNLRAFRCSQTLGYNGSS